MGNSGKASEFQYKEVAVSDLALDSDNPRLANASLAKDAVSALVSDARVLEMAKDIAAHGLNPMDIWGVVAINGDGKAPYVVVEGNRRLCAVMLLSDPDRAPSDKRESFKQIQGIRPTRVQVVEFNNREAATAWLPRMHMGGNEGVGRVQWTPEAKQRHFGETGAKDQRFSLAVVDALVGAGWLPQGKSKGKLSVVERFVADPASRAMLGLTFEKDTLLSTYDDNTQREVLKIFATQLQTKPSEGGVNTRFEKEQREQWAARLRSKLEAEGTSLTPVAAHPLSLGTPAQQGSATRPEGAPHKTTSGGTQASATATGPAGSAASQPTRPKASTSRGFQPEATKLFCAKDVSDRLQGAGNTKLQLLHHDLCSVTVNHVGLLGVGIWAFLEVLTKLAGRADGSDFVAFINSRIQTLLPSLSKDEAKHIKAAVARVQADGNATKHSLNSGGFDSKQLATDWEALQPLLVALLDNARRGASAPAGADAPSTPATQK